ncbi:MAG: hypothetical protein AAF740_00685 [Bacteroidota bacterium]
MRRFFVFILLFSFFGLSVSAQHANSPYSRFGVGDLLSPQSVASHGIGGIGVSYFNPVSVNVSNPALLTANTLTAFEGAGSVEEKILSAPNGEQRDFLGNLDYLAFSFPISRKMRLGMGLQGYSRVNYENIVFEKVEGSDRFAEYNYSGNGGITQAHVSTAWEPFSGFSVGAQAFYNFGRTENKSASRILGGDFIFSDVGQIDAIQLNDRVNYSDFSFKFGAFYRYQLPNLTYLNVGVTYEPQTDISATRFRALESVNYRNAVIERDTIVTTESLAPRLPERLTFGFMVQKPINEAGRSRKPTTYALGAEISWQDWTQTNDVNFAGSLKEQFRVSVGGEITPNIVDATASYLNKITYRAGYHYDQTPFAPGGDQFIEQGVSLGFSMPNPKPSNRFQSFSRLHLAFTYGQRNFTDVDYSETFYRVRLGLTVQQPWFYRRRYD